MLHRWEEQTRKFGFKLYAKSWNHHVRNFTKLTFRASTYRQSDFKYPYCISLKEFHTRAHIILMPPCGANVFRTLISTINQPHSRFTRLLHTGTKVTNAKVMHYAKWKGKSTTRSPVFIEVHATRNDGLTKYWSILGTTVFIFSYLRAVQYFSSPLSSTLAFLFSRSCSPLNFTPVISFPESILHVFCNSFALHFLSEKLLMDGGCPKESKMVPSYI